MPIDKKEIEKYFAEKAATEKRLKENLNSMSAAELKRATKYFTYAEKRQLGLTNAK